jgi:hypothetical protein
MKVKCLVSEFTYIGENEVYNVLREDGSHYCIEVAGFPMGRRYHKDYFKVVSDTAKLDLTKPLQTKDGRAARILGTLNDGRLVGAITTDKEKQSEFPYHWSADGKAAFSGCDLMNVSGKPRTVTHKIRVFLCEAGNCGGVPPVGSLWITKSKPSSKHKVVGQKEIEVTITEGEGMAGDCECGSGCKTCQCGAR